ncbi:hypothetical protein JHK87_035046 [Glycine soja]|nr:hypothetical protein JHK87_035046 [Glycine soja]
MASWFGPQGIGVDDWLHVPSMEDAFSLGDCAGFLEHIGRLVLLALAQLASIYVYSGARNDINLFLSALLVVAQEAYCGCVWIYFKTTLNEKITLSKAIML